MFGCKRRYRWEVRREVRREGGREAWRDGWMEGGRERERERFSLSRMVYGHSRWMSKLQHVP